MTPRAFLIGLGAGFISAAVFLSATTGPLIARVLFFLLTALPLFLAGLGWGWRAGLYGAVSGGLVIALLTNPMGGLLFAISQAMPAVYLTYLASLNRTDASGGIEWYPIGRIVIAAALMAGMLALASVAMMGADAESVGKALRPLVEDFAQRQLPQLGKQTPMSPAEVDTMTELAVHVLPAATAVSWLGALLLNMWLAGRITRAAGSLERPWPDLAAIVYPRVTPGLLAVAIVLSFLPGFLGLASGGFTGALLFAYVLMGLAIIHFNTRGASWRPFALWGLYAALFILNAGIPFVLAILGLVDSLKPLRRGPPPPPGSGRGPD